MEFGKSCLSTFNRSRLLPPIQTSAHFKSRPQEKQTKMKRSGFGDREDILPKLLVTSAARQTLNRHQSSRPMQLTRSLPSSRCYSTPMTQTEDAEDATRVKGHVQRVEKLRVSVSGGGPASLRQRRPRFHALSDRKSQAMPPISAFDEQGDGTGQETRLLRNNSLSDQSFGSRCSVRKRSSVVSYKRKPEVCSNQKSLGQPLRPSSSRI